MKREVAVFAGSLAAGILVRAALSGNFPATPYHGLYGYGIYLGILNRHTSDVAIVLVILYLIYLLKELVRKFRHSPGNLILLVLNSLVFLLAGITFYQVFFVGVGFWGVPADPGKTPLETAEATYRSWQVITCGLAVAVPLTEVTLMIALAKTLKLLTR
jgi:hypothetical protein